MDRRNGGHGAGSTWPVPRLYKLATAVPCEAKEVGVMVLRQQSQHYVAPSAQWHSSRGRTRLRRRCTGRQHTRDDLTSPRSGHCDSHSTTPAARRGTGSCANEQTPRSTSEHRDCLSPRRYLRGHLKRQQLRAPALRAIQPPPKYTRAHSWLGLERTVRVWALRRGHHDR